MWILKRSKDLVGYIQSHGVNKNLGQVDDISFREIFGRIEVAFFFLQNTISPWCESDVDSEEV
jgi:hypothetical protein